MVDPSDSEPPATASRVSGIEEDGERVTVDTVHGPVAIDHDAGGLSIDDATRVARQLASAVTGTHASSTFHVEHEGGRSCEACALSLERRLRGTPGVFDA